MDSAEDSNVDCDITGGECLLLCNTVMSQSCDNTTCGVINNGTTGVPVRGTCKLENVEVTPNVRKQQSSNLRVKEIVGEKNGVVIEHGKDICRLDCTKGEKQCVNMKAYLNCNTTYIDCGVHGCEGAEIYVNTNKAPLSEESISTSNIIPKKLIINCLFYKSCAKSKFFIGGKYKYKPIINAPGHDSVQDSTIKCNEDCELFCGEREEASCKNLNMYCKELNTCMCFGGSCGNGKSIMEGTLMMTASPTVATSSPTILPTIEPSLAPSKKPTSNKLIIYNGQEGKIYLCKSNVIDCHMECNEKNDHCKGIKLISAAKNTKMICGKDGCKEAIIYLGTPSEQVLEKFGITEPITDFYSNEMATALIDCDKSYACKDFKLYILEKLLKVTIMAEHGVDNVKEALIESNSKKCILNCGLMNRTQSCKDVKMYGCNCIGEECKKKMLEK